MPHDPSDALAERLYVLSLALEATLAEQNFKDAQAIFNERASLIRLLEDRPPANSSKLLKVVAIDKRIERDMLERSKSLADQLRKGSRGIKALRAYKANRAPLGAELSSY